jgi:hypothetical protein
MRTRGNERVSVRQGSGYGCRYGTLNEANLLKTTRTCCSLEHDLNTSSPTDKSAPLVGGISVHCVTRQAVLVHGYFTDTVGAKAKIVVGSECR